METIWFKDIKGFIDRKNYLNFFPSKNMNTIERLNAIMRFTLYFTIVLYFLKNDYRILFITVFIAMLTYILYTMNEQKEAKEREEFTRRNEAYDQVADEACQLPSKENPFMNVLISDLPNTDTIPVATKKKACDINNEEVKKMTQEYFEDNLYRDVDDVYGKIASDRNYYTMPNTEVVNDLDAVKAFIYQTEPTCKEGTINCYKNVHNHKNIR